MTNEPSAPPASDNLAPYDREAWRFTISLDVHAEGAVSASMLVMQICQRLAQLCTDPLGGQALHEVVVGRVLNIVCFNDATLVDRPVDPAELSALQEAVAQLQNGAGLEALAGLIGGGAPAPGNGDTGAAPAGGDS